MKFGKCTFMVVLINTIYVWTVLTHFENLAGPTQMVSEIVPVVASDQYSERKIRHPAPCTSSPSPSMVSERQLPASSPIVSYTCTIGRLIPKKEKLFTHPSVKSPRQIIRPEQIRCLRRGHSQLFAGRVYKNVCKTKYNDVIFIM